MFPRCSWSQFPHFEAKEEGKEVILLGQHKVRKITQPSTTSIAELKGKEAESQEKANRKSKEPQAGEVLKKKRKLLSASSSTAKKAKVYLAQYLPYL